MGLEFPDKRRERSKRNTHIFEETAQEICLDLKKAIKLQMQSNQQTPRRLTERNKMPGTK
jgi:hypothetical protein